MNTFIDSAALTAVVAALVQSVKIAVGDGYNRFLPLLADVLGVVAGILFLGGGMEGALLGLMVGLSASGLYSQGRTISGL